MPHGQHPAAPVATPDRRRAWLESDNDLKNCRSQGTHFDLSAKNSAYFQRDHSDVRRTGDASMDTGDVFAGTTCSRRGRLRLDETIAVWRCRMVSNGLRPKTVRVHQLSPRGRRAGGSLHLRDDLPPVRYNLRVRLVRAPSAMDEPVAHGHRVADHLGHRESRLSD